MLRIRREPAASAAATALIAALDRDLGRRYPGEPIYGIDAPAFERDGGLFFVGYDEDVPVACAALRPCEGDVELKRMYVAEAARGRGYARQLLGRLETEAGRLGYARMLLQTGDKQHEAMALYESAGYVPVPVFGGYVASDFSRCYAKDLAAAREDKS